MTARRSLIAVVAWRVLAFGLIAMALQVALVFHDYWSDDETLARRLIELETGEIAAGLALSPDGHRSSRSPPRSPPATAHRNPRLRTR